MNGALLFVQKCTCIVPFEDLNKYLLAAAAYLLAAKTLDAPVWLGELAEAYLRLEHRRRGVPAPRINRYQRQVYEERITSTEFEILCNIGFDCELELPSIHIAQFCAAASAPEQLERHAYMFLNDAFLTPAVLYFHPKVLAAACLNMSFLFLSKMGFPAELPDGWLSLIDDELTPELVGEAKEEIKKVY